LAKYRHIIIDRSNEFYRLITTSFNDEAQANGANVLTVACANPALGILVIAHDEPIGKIVAAMLRSEDYECEGVSEQKAILRVLKRVEDYRLLFCQVAALEEEEQLLKWALGAGRDIPIVACAARSREHIPKVIYERCTFLQLPFDREQLLNVVREALTKANC
jgi:DNA-binding NtrC family response regulator